MSMAKSERNGNRKSRSSFQRRTPDLGYYIVVTDTQETEANYLLGLRNSLPQKIQDRIVIKVETAATKDLVRMCLYHSNVDPQYRQPWIVFDRDQVKDFDQIIANARQNDIEVG